MSRSTSYGLGLRVLVNGAWGFAATNRVEPAPARARRRTGRRDRQAPTPCSPTRKVVARQRRQGRDDLDERVQARSVRGAARNQDRVPDEAERDGAGRAGRQLRQLADAVRRRAEVLRLERRLAHHAAAGAHLSAVHAPRPPIAPAAISRRAPSSIARSCVGYEYVEDYPWLRDAEKAGHEVVEKLKVEARRRRPLRHRRRSVAAVPRDSRIGRPLDRARSLARLGSEHGGHELPQGRPTPASCASARRSSTSSAIARSPAASRPPATTTRA